MLSTVLNTTISCINNLYLADVLCIAPLIEQLSIEGTPGMFFELMNLFFITSFRCGFYLNMKISINIDL